MEREARAIVEAHATGDDSEQWNTKEIHETLAALHPDLGAQFTEDKVRSFHECDALTAAAIDALRSLYEEKCAAQEAGAVAQAEKVVTLRSIDTHWMDHIDDMAHLREQVAFAGYAQRDPLIEYQDQGFRRFQALIATIDSTIVRTLLQIDFAQFAPSQILAQAEQELAQLQTNEAQIEGELGQTGAGAALGRAQGASPLADPLASGIRMQAPAKQQTINASSIGRNDPCPCGSGKKFKKCHGKNL